MQANVEKIILTEHPDVFLILGDTYSGLSVDVAKKYQIPIVHMEAGNRSFDMNMPEEQNRIHIDHQSNYLLPYTNSSKENLLKEGMDEHNIFVFGNPIVDVLNYYKNKIDNSGILSRLELKPKDYFLVTIHRAENTNDLTILTNILNGLNLISVQFNKKIIWGIHPRTKSKMSGVNVTLQENIKIYDSFDFFDFVKLEKNAYLILTDSGTVQEEASLFNVPTVTIRENTERPETITCGSNILSGTKNADNILKTVKLMSRKQTN
ncbi:MAG: UDP-N-acetylglucosamine 2-epimerase (non-hydrolyzing) [Candidatus Paceibacterota bacterium]|jgi:UDP-N-acetylglucosamine 2-epimerase (non-hydrolysing)